VLGSIGKALKNPVQYQPSFMTYNMGLNEYEIETMKFVKVPCPLFEARSGLFPPFFENLLLVLDITTINPVCFMGTQPFSYGSTASMTKGQGGYNTYTDWFVNYVISTEMNNADSSFYMNMNGI
jgi:hypothetical protein